MSTEPAPETTGTAEASTVVEEHPTTSTTTPRTARPAAGWRGTPTGDVGILVLRLTLAASFIGHGAQKFGFFGGPGIQGFAAGTLAPYGFRFPIVLAYVNGLTELVGGVLVALGALTPLAACSLMAVMIDSTLLKFSNGFFFTNPGGYEIDVALGGMAAGVVLLGAGRIALDAAVPVMRRVQSLRWVLLAVGVAAALATYFLLR